MDNHNGHLTGDLFRETYDIIISKIDSSKQSMNFSSLGDGEWDDEYAWLLDTVTNTNGKRNIIKDKDYGENENENENNIDPQYSSFLEGLIENGKSYKLKISGDNETPCFLEYEESDGYELPTDTNFSFGNDGDNMNSSENTVPMQIDQGVKSSLLLENKKSLTTKEISRRKDIIINVHNKSLTEPCINGGSCYQVLLDGCVPSEYGVFDYEGKQVKYEEAGTSSDSEIVIWENNKQPVPAEKDSFLKNKLMLILKKPYDQEEYEDLLQYAEQKRPICRLLDLRDRSVSSALNGVTKSVLDYVPAISRRLEAAQNDRPRALNLLRMLRFWLEHLPNKDSFRPWTDEDCLRALPSNRT